MQNILFFFKYIKIIFKKPQGTVVALKPEILVYCAIVLRGKNTFPRFSKCRVGLKKQSNVGVSLYKGEFFLEQNSHIFIILKENCYRKCAKCVHVHV